MLANRTVNLLRSFARRLPGNGFAIRLGSSGSRRPPPITVTAAPKAHAKAQPREAQMPANLVHPALEGLSGALGKGNVREFVQELKALANSPTIKPQPELLVDRMDGMVERITMPRDVADWISSLGKLGFQASIPQQRALIVKSVEQLCRAKGLNIINIGMSLDGLLKTDLKLSYLPSELSSGLMKVIDQAADQLDPRNLANVLKALGKLGATWTSLPLNIQQVLLRSFEKNAAQMTVGLGAALTVHSFGQLELDINTLSDEQRQLVFKFAMKGINAEVPGQSAGQVCQQNAMTVLGSGKMGVKHASLPDECATHLESCLLSTLKSMSAQEVSNVIYACGLMGWQWTTVSPALQLSFQQAALSQLRIMSLQSMFMTFHGLANMDAKWTKLLPEVLGAEQSVANTIHSLGKIEAPWQSFPPAFHAAVVDAFILLQAKLSAQGISNFIYGLGCMGTPFQDLSPAFMMAVQKTVHRLSASSAEPFEPQEISNILLGFAYLGASWDQLPAKELEHLLIRLARSMSAQAVANSIHSLAVMEATWQCLSSDTVRALASAFAAIEPSMISQAVANSMYGLTLLCFDFQPTSMDSSPAELEKEQLVWRMIRAAVGCFKLLGRNEYGAEDINQFAIFFEWLSGLPGGMDLISKELGSRPTFINPDGVHAPTALHFALSQALPKALQQLQPAGQFRIANEFDGLGGHVFDMDMAVHEDGKLIAFVEVDGRDHYSADGKKLKRIDRLKEFLYAHRYPGVAVHHIKNQHLAKGADAAASGLAKDIC